MSKKHQHAPKQRKATPLRSRQAPTPHLAALFHEGRAALQRGDLLTAEARFRQVLAALPQHAETLHLLGVVLYQTRRLDEAAVHMKASIDAAPGTSSFRSNYGLVLHAQNRLDEAAVQYHQALALNPNHAEAHNNLGNVLHLQGKLAAAAAQYREALRLNPNYLDAHTNLGAVTRAQGDLDGAMAHYRNALALKPSDPTAHYNLGNALADGGDHNNATAAYAHAIAVDPSSAKAHYNLGNALCAQDKDEEALAEFHRALALDPANVGAHTNIGVTLQGQGRLPEATASYHRALAIDPEEAKAHLNLGMAHLLLGDFAAGWPHYEYRHAAAPEAAPRAFEQPRWRGEPLAGRRILLHPEQGLGDTLEFMRYAPLVQQAGGRVLLQVHPSLLALAREMARDCPMEVLSTTDPLPAFDLECPMLSLPLAFHTTVETIPAKIPYLRAPAEQLAAAEAIPWPASGLRVGLAWGGNPDQGRDRFRSMPLTALEPVLRLEGVHFFSLQIGPPAAQLQQMPEGSPKIVDLAPHLHTMADTAACIAHLDLVLTVCTSVSHLAGALGARTWVMLAHVADWRWFTDREDCPWYPSARLFRQPSRGDWAAVADQVAAALTTVRDQQPARRETLYPLSELTRV